METLHARMVFCGEVSDGVLSVMFAEDTTGDGVCLGFQRAATFDEQDRALGMDTYCVTLGTGEAVYGGVDGWSLAAGLLRLRLSAEAAEVLDLQRDVLIEFDASLATNPREWLVKVLQMPPDP